MEVGYVSIWFLLDAGLIQAAEANTFFFALSSRLARQTGNKTYVEYAEKVWDWLYDIELIDHDTFAVYDGSSVKSNCTQISKVQRSGAASSLALGAAYMYNQVCFIRLIIFSSLTFF